MMRTASVTSVAGVTAKRYGRIICSAVNGPWDNRPRKRSSGMLQEGCLIEHADEFLVCINDRHACHMLRDHPAGSGVHAGIILQHQWMPDHDISCSPLRRKDLIDMLAEVSGRHCPL